MKEELLFREKC